MSPRAGKLPAPRWLKVVSDGAMSFDSPSRRLLVRLGEVPTLVGFISTTKV